MKQEDYLDRLLNSVSDEKKDNMDFLDEAFGDLGKDSHSVSFETLDDLFQDDEEDFVKNLEEEFGKTSSERYMEEFEAELEDMDATASIFDERDIASEEISVEEPSMEDTLMEEPSMEDALMEEASMEDALMEEPSMGDTLMEEASMEDASMEEASMEDASMQGALREEASEEEALMDESLMGESLMDESSLSEEGEMSAEDIISGAINHMNETQEKADDDDAISLSEDIETANEEISVLPEAEELPLTEDGEGDLTGNSDDDLLSLLSGEGGLDDIGSLLSAEESDTPVEGEDPFQDFMEQEMQGTEASISESGESGEEDEEEGGKKKKKKKRKEKGEKQEKGEKKEGFFKKILHALFKEPEEMAAEQADAVELKTEGTADILELSEENMQILRELEAADGDASGSGEEEKEDGKKKKKEKKEKKEKPKKEKKPKEKKEKKPKEKKERKPFFNDPSPKLPVVPVVLILVMVGSLSVMVMLAINLGTYQDAYNNAKSYYALAASNPDKYENYIFAYEEIAGREVKEANEEFYQKVELVAVLADAYRDFENFYVRGEHKVALDNLICVIGRYEVNYESAELFHCEAEMKQLDEMATQKLEEIYGMSRKDAVDLYKLRTRRDYSKALYVKLKELGLE